MLEVYGPSIIEYKGTGHLFYDLTNSLQLRFECVQLHNGDIYIHLTSSEDIDPGSVIFIGPFLRGHHLDKIEGRLNNGMIIKSVGPVHGLKSSISSDKFEILLLLSQIEAAHETSDMQKNPNVIRFSLTNLRFIGDISPELRVASLTFTVEDVRIIIRQVPNYNEIEKTMNATKNCTVTSYLDIPYDDNISKQIDLVDNLCDLLSFALGTRITWPYYQILDRDGVVLTSFHRNCITTNFGSVVLINPDNRTDLRHFIESTYSSYVKLKPKYELRSILDTIVRSKLSTDFIELRALYICSAVDVLRGKWSNMNGHSEIVKKRYFKNKYGELQKVVAQFARTQFSATDTQIEHMTKKVSELNRPPLNDILKMMINDIGADIPVNDINNFKKNRDKLVHDASFETENKVDDFFNIIYFADRLLLSLLGYSGPYYDVRTWTIATFHNKNSASKPNCEVWGD